MRCAWDAYLSLLPVWLREPVDRLGKNDLQELRMRVNAPPELLLSSGCQWVSRKITGDDIQYVLNSASHYSPWSAATLSKGYITAPGGHRIGVCGEAVMVDQTMQGIRFPSMLCIRVARDFTGIAEGIPLSGRSVLIIGRPGSGKTTLLRDLIRRYSSDGPGSVAVVDERGELFPKASGAYCFPIGKRTDVMTGCSKPEGIEALLRCMGPSVIAVDEITAEEDCNALIHAGWCGVQLLATAHAGSMEDLKARPVYRSIMDKQLFDKVLILQQDKSWKLERILR